jgi:hypothetical protein
MAQISYDRITRVTIKLLDGATFEVEFSSDGFICKCLGRELALPTDEQSLKAFIRLSTPRISRNTAKQLLDILRVICSSA